MSVLFPKWLNALPTLGAAGGAGGLVTVVLGTWYWATPDFFEVGYMPHQPSSGFSHQIHAGKLGMDCRYCHTKVEQSPEANIPNVATCYGCHAETRLKAWQTQQVSFIREAYATDESIQWRRVHKLPDYVRNFPHHVHVNAGVSCYSCHGQIIGMPEVYQAHSLSMGWCLDCHRDPEASLVPHGKVTDLIWVEEQWMTQAVGQRSEGGVTPVDLLESIRQAPPQNCGACHH